ncbi:MAG: PGPGW domain-containing protein [Pirellulales bacterium]|nr:PGPGW domain-containing protein [Pirellulales bacterium]
MRTEIPQEGRNNAGTPLGDSCEPPSRNGGEAAVRAVLRQARRLIVLVVGTTVLLFGVVLLVTPGPAFVVIPIGLAILSIEFAWARRLLQRVKHGIRGGVDWRNWDDWMWMIGLRKRPRKNRQEQTGC